MNESDLFIASTLVSLLDLLKTEISRGKHVHCQFSCGILQEDKALLYKCKKSGIKKLTFTAGGAMDLEAP